MIFKQLDDGGCDIVFEDKEIEIIKKKKKLILTSTGLRHFSNNLMNIIAMWHVGLNEEDKNLKTLSGKVEIDDKIRE